MDAQPKADGGFRLRKGAVTCSDLSSRRISDFENADVGHISVTDAAGPNDGGYSSLYSYFFGRNNRDPHNRRSKSQ